MSPAGRPRKPRLAYEHRILLLALLVALPGTLAAVVLLWTGDFAPKTRWTLTILIGVVTWGLAYSLRNRVIVPFQTLSNLLAALREGDFSIRARGAGRHDVHGDVMLEINALTKTLREQRLDSVEATTLLRQVMAEIDVAIFAFDEERRLCLVNRAGERLLGRPAERLQGKTAEEIDLGVFLEERPPAILEQSFPGGAGRWEVRRSSFRQGGLPMQMLVLTDVSRALRMEERRAWQRLIRVFSHELNNSLTPIQSISGSLRSLLRKEPRPVDWEEDMSRGLGVITSRSEALNRFLDAYARLARLPEPEPRAVDLAALVGRVARLETRIPVKVESGESLTLQADGDQLEQLLINIVRNATDASLQTGGAVRLGWSRHDDHVDVFVRDEGPGLSSSANLFVPFFTTKPGGSGIGLVLSRQIAEAHNGTLTLKNRDERQGCEARLSLPLV